MPHSNLPRRLALGLLAVVLLLAACDGSGLGGQPSNALVLRWVHSTSLNAWAAQVTDAFNRQRINAGDGRPIYIEAVSADAGQAVADMLAGAELPVLWTAADPQWREVLHQSAGREIFLPNCVSIAESPLVIAMWEPVARALGWPGSTLGWLDTASLAADPSGWAYYSGGEWGQTLRLGHSHPGLSESGAQTLLALVYAAEASPDQISVDAVQNPIVQASVGAFESAVAWFSTSTDQLAATMLERGITYLNAGIMYENAVITQGERDPRLVAIYPYEGTFVATFPTCVRAEMDDTTTHAAETFLAYLRDVPAQTQALALGLRPINDAVALGAPIDAAHGADPAQPARVFASTSPESVFAIQELWQAQRKNVNLAMVLDISGSMEGQKIELLRLSAIEFVAQMGDRDQVTVIIFDNYPRILVPATRIEGNRQNIINQINTITAGGGTALYDSIAFTAEAMLKTSRADTANAMVVLTDGQDTSSSRFHSPDATFSRIVFDSGASVYTIAYGDDADRTTMRNIALATNGIFYEGNVGNIGAIYAEISAAFGGSAGIGR